MERAQISEKIKEIVANIIKHDNFVMSDQLLAAEVDGWNSLTHMLIISEIENSFKVKFKLKELNKLENMGSLIDLVYSKINSQ